MYWPEATLKVQNNLNHLCSYRATCALSTWPLRDTSQLVKKKKAFLRVLLGVRCLEYQPRRSGQTRNAKIFLTEHWGLLFHRSQSDRKRSHATNQKRLIDLFISRTQDTFSHFVVASTRDNKPISHLKNLCFSRKYNETGNQKPYRSWVHSQNN